ncbi:MAG TPA: Crp/Fnr family transcriptional regulator [Desulfobacteraceae bacterium]|nr:Crp/Fnr family transcriptional regulator [Desulfobacteraceae bacterium]
MVSVEDLKKIILFENLTDKMLEQLLPIVQVQSFEGKQNIFEKGSPASHFYSLRRGKVLLQAELASLIIISLGAIKPGYSFGWAAFRKEVAHTSRAVCAEPSEVFIMPKDELFNLFERDHTMGFFVMRKAADILANRLERRTTQFLKVITKHPDIAELLGL